MEKINIGSRYNSIRKISSRSVFPHLTLVAGTVKPSHALASALNDLQDNVRTQSLISDGLGVFVRDTPVIYLRWQHSKELLNLRQIIAKTLESHWVVPHEFCDPQRWVAKTTIGALDTRYEDLGNILAALRQLNFSQDLALERLDVLEYNVDGERSFDIASLES
jgi:2'-5' RNA ligase